MRRYVTRYVTIVTLFFSISFLSFRAGSVVVIELRENQSLFGLLQPSNVFHRLAEIWDARHVVYP